MFLKFLVGILRTIKLLKLKFNSVFELRARLSIDISFMKIHSALLIFMATHTNPKHHNFITVLTKYIYYFS